MPSATKNSLEETLAQLLVQLRSGKLKEAAPRLKKILSDHPDNFEALRLNGIAAHLQGKTDQAVKHLSRAVELEPEAAETHYNLGVMQSSLKQAKPPLTTLGRSIELDPSNAEAYDALGSLLSSLRQHGEAVKYFQRAIAIRPEFAEAHNNLGIALTAEKKFPEAATTLRQAIKLDPGSVEAHINLGGVLNHLREYEEAADILEKAIAIKEDMAEAHHNLGISLSNLKKHEEALSAFERAVAIRPGHDSAFSFGALMARRICDWSNFSKTQAELLKRVHGERSAISPFVTLAFCDDPADQFLSARQYTKHKKFEDTAPVTSKASTSDKRIRIAYVSADFREHPVAHQMAELFELHDRSRFEIVGVSIGRDDKSKIGTRLRNSFDKYLNVRSHSNDSAAQLLAREGIHIAVDLNGYTGDARPELFAYRPAPIQVNYLGYPCTMGADFMDYIVVDKTIAPAKQQSNFSEKLVHIPDTYMVTDGKRDIAAKTPTRGELNLPEDGVVFCCFHNSYKITPDIFDIWMRLLEAVPGSVVWLRVDDAAAMRNLRGEAKARGMDPDRLINAERKEMADHMARHALADFYLDTLPYNAHSSACDALLGGLPVVTCEGKAFASRVAASLLRAAGMPELVTGTLQDYEALALKLAREPEYLSGLRQKLARNIETRPLFDCARFCRHLESAYETMFERWRAGKPPARINVKAAG